MWNATAYGGGGGGGFGGAMQNYGGDQGGGFINTGSPGFGSQNEKRKNERVNNVVPVTVAMIMNASESEEHLKIGSMPAHMLTVVGLVKTVDEQSTRIVYTLDDMTGPPLEIQMWLGENDELTSEKRSAIMENTYIRVTGSMRTVKGKRLLVAFKVSPIKDVNEITMHLLEVVHTSMAVAVMDNQTSMSNANHTMNTANGSYGMMTNQMQLNVKSEMHSGLNRQQQMVLQVISSDQSPEGVSYKQLSNTLKSLNQSDIRSAVEFLSNEGHIYSTIDDDHFKSTE